MSYRIVATSRLHIHSLPLSTLRLAGKLIDFVYTPIADHVKDESAAR